MNPGEDDGPDTDITVIFNRNVSKLQATGKNGDLNALFHMLRGKDFDGRAYPHVLANRDATRTMQKALLADPSIASDDHLVLMVALEDRLVADIDIVAQLDVFRMEYQDARFQNDIGAEGTKICSRINSVPMGTK